MLKELKEVMVSFAFCVKGNKIDFYFAFFFMKTLGGRIIKTRARFVKGQKFGV